LSEIHVRTANADDADAIARIYNHYILESTTTFHTQPVDASERELWMAERGDVYPTIAAEEDGCVCAWGSLSRYVLRPGWDPTAEVSIYVDPAHTGCGIGSLLMDDLLARASQLGFHTVISQITGGNQPSVALAEKAGFRKAGVLREAGLKLGTRLDVTIMQLVLSDDESRT